MIDYKTRCEEAANSLTKEKRQEFVDLMWSGKTVGQSRDQLGISDDAATGIMLMNIVKNTNRTFNKISN